MIIVKSILVIAALALFSMAFVTTQRVAATAAASGPRDIYLANCAKCHGADGRAQTARGKRAGATDFTSDWNRDQARGIRIITNGRHEMPSFKGKLTAAEISSVFGYVSRF